MKTSINFELGSILSKPKPIQIQLESDYFNST